MPEYMTPGVYVEEVSSGSKPIEAVGTAVAGFLGFASKGPFNKPTLCTNWSQFVTTFGDFVPNAYLAHAVYGYFNNGGGTCYVARLSVGDNAKAAAPVAKAALPSRAADGATTLSVVAKQGGDDGEGITVEVSPGEADTVEIRIRQGTRQEEFTGLSFSTAKEAKNIVAEVNKGSRIVTLQEEKLAGISIADRLPAAGTFALAATAPAPLTIPKTGPKVYEGDVADRSGIGGFEAIDEITMICAPDLMGAYLSDAIDADGVKAVQLAMIAHCERMKDRVAILDPMPGLDAQSVKDWRMNKAGYDSKYAALYYPWIRVADPTPGGAPTITIPPSGHIAGVWARSDGERGVHKAPANEVLRGVLDLENNLTKAEQGLLNPDGVNCIRAFPGMGIRVWGARTLSSDPEWRYLNVRRLFNMVEESIEAGTQWAVFEPNDHRLWAAIDRNVTSFLTTQWRSGALFGRSTAEAFFVKVDAENNPPEERDLGRLHIDIGIAPVKPAEFVIFRISQLSENGASAA